MCSYFFFQNVPKNAKSASSCVVSGYVSLHEHPRSDV